MNKINLNFEVTGCTNRCMHCYCRDLYASPRLMKMTDVLELSHNFRRAIRGDVSVMLLQEQTLYPQFVELVNRLKCDGFMSVQKGLLITNGYGIVHQSNIADALDRLYNAV